MTAVFLDLYFVVNFCMDILILWGTAKVNHLAFSTLRIGLGALVGASYAILEFSWPGSVVYSPVFRIIFAFVMTFVALHVPIRNLLRIMATFFVITLCVGGGAFALKGLLESGTMAVILSSRETPVFGLVAGGGILALVLVMRLVPGLRDGLWKELVQVTVILFLGDRSVNMKGLVDTGNQLVDPLTLKPVIIVEYESIKSLLPVDLCRALERCTDPDPVKIMEDLGVNPWANRLALIPFTTVGNRGVLLGFRPDQVFIITGGRATKTRKVVVGILRSPLSPGGNEYSALINPALLEVS